MTSRHNKPKARSFRAPPGERMAVKKSAKPRAAEKRPKLNPALMHAARSRSLTDVQRLLAEGASPDSAGAAGSQTEGNLVETVRLLLAAGADVTATDGDGNTALHRACHNGHTAVIEMLLAAGADMRTLNREGRLPGESAVWGGHTDIVRLLIDRAGAIASIDDALVFAASQGRGSLAAGESARGLAQGDCSSEGEVGRGEVARSLTCRCVASLD
ncbi:hypothetical protein COCOR_01859 [Corallococcus coralloides DSM 2259]|uniref:Uncharacterized protein n=2 Tax=Corallococcus coralloides TaxID=184914 RepID=H8MEX0_CORCM|nr:hypothetical protein COCOR_01859 [Corallococcus coralloides DSM 2259]